MEIFGRKVKPIFQRDSSSLSDPAKWLLNVFGTTKSKVQVTADTALSMSAVWACIKIISETVAQLPWNIYENTENGRVQWNGDVRSDMLKHSPNGIMTSFVYRFALMAQVLSRGNSYSLIKRNGNGVSESLTLLNPDKVTPFVYQNELFYHVQGMNEPVHSDDMIHVIGFTYDGIIGKSPITVARENIGLGIAAQNFGANFFGNGTALSGILKTNKILDPIKKAEIKNEWSSEYGLGSNGSGTAVLDADMEFKPISLPPDDAQFIETRKFQTEEIARIFNVPPHMIKHLEKSSFNNIEQQSLEFIKYTVGPWIKTIEQEFDKKLFTPSEKKRLYNKLSVNGLLRGDVKSRSQFYKDLFFIGALSPNEIRDLEEMNDRDQGDLYFTPVNMIDNEQLVNEKTVENE